MDQSEPGLWKAPTPTAFVVAAHGGAGATTLASFLDDMAVVEVARAELTVEALSASTGAQAARPTPVVVVALGTARGAAAAVRLALDLCSRGIPVVVAVVADGMLHEPIAVRARLRLLRGRVVDVIRVPYVAHWRFLDEPARVPRRFVNAITRIRAAVEPNETGESRGKRAGNKPTRSENSAGRRRSENRKERREH